MMKTVTLPAGTDEDTGLLDGIGLIKPIKHAVLGKRGLMLGKTLVRIEKEIPARIWNLGNEDVIIYKGTTLWLDNPFQF